MIDTIQNVLANPPYGLPRDEVLYLLENLFNTSRAAIYAHPEQRLSGAEIAQLELHAKRRKAGEPLAYILGRKEFWKQTLEVNPDTLIPRPETELLIEYVLSLQTLPAEANILDLGTGSGAIGIALATEKPRWQILATDNCTEALATAKRNGSRYATGNIHFIQSNWFSGK